MIETLPRSTSSDSHPDRPQGELLLGAKNLKKSFGGQVVLAGVSLQLNKGEVVLLRGANGTGKTTLLNILTGSLEPEEGEIHIHTNVVESFVFPQRSRHKLERLSRFTPEQLSQYGIGRTWQDIRLFNTQTLRSNIAVAVPNQLGEKPACLVMRPKRVFRQERKILGQADRILSTLGLQGRETSSADKISLGQAKRVAIARAVESGAQVLFLDEPLAGLDADGVDDVLGLLNKLVSEHDITLVIIEHVINIPHFLRMVTAVWTLADGRMRVSSPNEIRTEFGEENGDSVFGLPRGLKNPKHIERQAFSGGAVLFTCSGEHSQVAEPFLEVRDLVVHRGRRLVIGTQKGEGLVAGVSFTLRPGEPSVIQAPNGWGKTTLLEAIAGLLPITRGEILLNKRPIQELPPWERSKLGLSLLRSRDNTFLSLSVKESLSLCNVDSVPRDMTPLLGKIGSDLSGGERQKIAFACFQGNNPCVLMFDEPFSALDTTGLEAIWRTVADKHHLAVLIVIPKVAKED